MEMDYKWLSAFADERLKAVKTKVESYDHIVGVLESGKIFREADVPKGKQATVMKLALEYLDRALRDSAISAETCEELEVLRLCLPKEEEDDETDETGLNHMLVSRVLTTAAKSEISRLRKAYAGNSKLMDALSRRTSEKRHQLTILALSHEDLWPQRRAPLRARIFDVRPLKALATPTALLGALAEVDRYVNEANGVLKALGFEPLTSDEKYTIVYNASQGTKLRELMDRWETEQEIHGKTESHEFDFDALYTHLVRATRRLEESTETSNGLMLAANTSTARTFQRSPRPARSPAPSATTTFDAWRKRNPNRCVKCEKMGHIGRDCQSPLPITSLAKDNPLKSRSNAPPAAGAYTATVGLSVNLSSASHRDAQMTILDTGAGGVSFVRDVTFMDPRSVKTFPKPIPVQGIGTETLNATCGGTAYVRVHARTGEKTYDDVILRFDALIVPDLKGPNLLSTSSLLYDGGFDSIVALEKGTGKPSPLGLRTAALGALTDLSKRVEIECRLDRRSGLPTLPELQIVPPTQIAKLVPKLPETLGFASHLFAQRVEVPLPTSDIDPELATDAGMFALQLKRFEHLHQRLGHRAPSNMKETCRLLRIPWPAIFDKIAGDFSCEACCIVKLREQSRLPALSVPKATKPMQRVYMDTVPIVDSDIAKPTAVLSHVESSDIGLNDATTWKFLRPLDASSPSLPRVMDVNNPQHLVVFVDEYTRYVWVYPLTEKTSESLGIIFHHWWKTQMPLVKEQRSRSDSSTTDWDLDTLAVHTDAGSEFQGRFREMLTIRNVQHVVAPSHQLWKNGVAEGRIKLLKQLIGICDVQFCTPRRETYVKFAEYAAGMLNMLPTAQLAKRNFSSPWEALFARLPKPIWLLPLGATLYVRDYRSVVQRQGPGRKAYFLGIATGPIFGFKVHYATGNRRDDVVHHAVITSPTMTSSGIALVPELELEDSDGDTDDENTEVIPNVEVQIDDDPEDDDLTLRQLAERAREGTLERPHDGRNSSPDSRDAPDDAHDDTLHSAPDFEPPAPDFEPPALDFEPVLNEQPNEPLMHADSQADNPESVPDPPRTEQGSSSIVVDAAEHDVDDATTVDEPAVEGGPRRSARNSRAPARFGYNVDLPRFSANVVTIAPSGRKETLQIIDPEAYASGLVSELRVDIAKKHTSRIRVLDLFSGSHSVEAALRDAGVSDYFEVISVDIDKSTNPTWCGDVCDLRDTLMYDHENLPAELQGPFHIVWASPPCTAYSAANTCRSDEVTAQQLEEADRRVLAAWEIVEHIAPIAEFTENPDSGALRLALRPITLRTRKNVATTTYCCWGRKDRKATAIITNLTLNLPDCRRDEKCLTKQILGVHLQTAQRGSTTTSSGTTVPGTATKNAQRVPIQLIQRLFAEALRQCKEQFEIALSSVIGTNPPRRSTYPVYPVNQLSAYAVNHVTESLLGGAVRKLSEVSDAELLEAKQKELHGLIERGVFDVAQIDQNESEVVRPLSHVWVLKVRSDDTVKARLCAGGHRQTHGLNFWESSSPTPRKTSIMISLATAAINGWVIHTADVSQAYVASELRSPVDMRVPRELLPILIQLGLCDAENADTAVLRLKRSLYGLVQSGRNWHSEISRSLSELGWRASDKDPCVFYLPGNMTLKAIINIYVDDLLFMGEPKQYDIVIEQLRRRYDITSTTGDDKVILWNGMEIRRPSRDEIKVTQVAKIREMAREYAHELAQIKGKAETPEFAEGDLFDPRDMIDLNQATKQQLTVLRKYQQMVGSAMYVMCCTRFDVAYALSKASKVMHAASERHLRGISRLVKYLVQHEEVGVTFDGRQCTAGNVPHVSALVDANYAAEPLHTHNAADLGRKSTSAAVFMACGGPIFWKSKLQSSVSMNTGEAEFRSLANAIKEIYFVRNFLQELGFPTQPIPMFCDAAVAIAQAKRDGASWREGTRQYEVTLSAVYRACCDGIIVPIKIPTDDNFSDLLTKSLNQELSKKHRERITGDAGPYQAWLLDKLSAFQGTELPQEGFLSRSDLIASAGITV